MMKNRKLHIRTILMLLLVVGMGDAWAQTASIWDGATKYTTLAAAGITGAGTEASPYIIDNANKFVAFGYLVTNAYWKLTADIDLGGNEWPYSGNNAKTFKGHFDGDNHIVKNYTITPISKKANGLFATVQGSSATNRAEIKNLKIDDVTITTTADLSSTTHIGALVGNSNQYVDFKNIQIVDVNGNGNTVNITFDNLVGNCNVGGLIGSLQKNSTIEDCTVNKPVVLIKGESTTIAGTCYIGGAIGYVVGSNSTDVTRINKPALGSENGLTVNYPSVTVHKTTTANNTSWYVGSTIGRIQNYSDVNCITVDNPTLEYKAVDSPNNALYLGTLAGHIQGNVGSATADPVSTPVKNISITGTSSITIGTGTEEIKNVRAGIVGLATTNVDIDNWNIATSNITVNGSLTTSNDYFGGAIGQVSSAQSLAAGTDQTSINHVTSGSSTITINGNVVKESHIGSVFGRVEGTVGNATNYPKRTIVTNVTTTGTTKVVFGSNSNNVDVANARAGAIGSAAANADISDCTLADTEVEVNGNLITGASYIGGIVGLVQSSTTPNTGIAQGAVATKVHDITVKKSDVNVTGNVGAQCYVGGAFGQVTGATSTTVAPQATEITDINIKNTSNTGISSVTIGTNNTNTINYVRAGGVIGMANTNVILDDWDIENTNVEINGKLVTTSSNIGGCVGTLQSVNNAPVKATNIQITKSDIVAINGDVEKEAYFGGVFGRMDGSNNTQNQPATADNVNVAGLNMTFGGNFTQNVYAGGIVGYLYAMNTTSCPNPTSVTNCSASGQIHSSNSKTFVQDKTYAFGGIVGYNNQNNTTNQSIIRQCISEVNINLSGYTPSTLTAGLSNLYKTGFSIGGVIGRLDNPSLLPEHLYYSGKIYAPFAAVGPIVGVFNKDISKAAYVYEDYSGEYAAPTLTAQEWQKANTWYYNDYKLGLSADVRTQTARTRNYSDPTTNIDGVEYLTVTDKTFNDSNSLNGLKSSRTVLRYTANNTNADFGIYPQWSTSSSAYPTYYMYYMQGVNRGVYMENGEFAKELINKELSVLPSIVRTQSGDNYTFTVSMGDIEDDTDFTISYQWYQKDGTTPIGGETSSSITLAESVIDSYGGGILCRITVSGTNFTQDVVYTLRGSSAIVVFVNGASGIDNNPGSTARGWTPETAVKTINHANSLLKSEADGGTWDKNIIVVMGELTTGTGDANAFKSRGTNPATLTGKWDGVDYEGIINLVYGNENKANPGDGPGKDGLHNYVSADTKFENLIFRAAGSPTNCFFDCHGHDVWFGKGLRMQGFINLSDNHGNLTEDSQTIPEFSVLLTASNLAHPEEAYWTRTKPQTLTIESGHYGRILGGRFIANFFNGGSIAGNTAHSILATAQHPAWAVINIDIDKDNDPRSADATPKNYTCDINCIIGGLTDGSIYGDYEINVRGGNVRYIVGANQGNGVRSGSKTFTPAGSTKNADFGQWPNSSFFGRSIINVEQNEDSKPIVINNLYAGGLGRFADKTDATVDMYVYGETEVNIKSGTIQGNVYGGGAGGVLGMNPWDPRVPYATTAVDNATDAVINGVQYGGMPAGSALANVVLHARDTEGNFTSETEMLNLANSSTTINISGGTISGSVYGGGDGFVSNMPVEKKITMQGVGSVFGETHIKISGGTIAGSIYGGSKGSDKYYNMTNVYGQTINHIAEMNGTVNLSVTGTDDHYPTIGGNIYGAGQGIPSTSTEEYLRIATAGNAELGEQYKTNINILIDLPESHPFTGNIYGGGEMGAVDGNTKVVIKHGTIEGDVFGGGKGETGHPNKAKVTGNTNIIVDSEWTETTPEP